MIGSGRQIAVYTFGEPVDIRKSFKTFSALVVGLGRDVLSGHFFLFVNFVRHNACTPPKLFRGLRQCRLQSRSLVFSDCQEHCMHDMQRPVLGVAAPASEGESVHAQDTIDRMAARSLVNTIRFVAGCTI